MSNIAVVVKTEYGYSGLEFQKSSMNEDPVDLLNTLACWFDSFEALESLLSKGDYENPRSVFLDENLQIIVPATRYMENVYLLSPASEAKVDYVSPDGRFGFVSLEVTPDAGVLFA